MAQGLDVKLINRRVDAAARKGLQKAAGTVGRTATDLAPVRQGTLRESETVSVDDDGRTAAVSFDTPYAVLVHESDYAQHTTGQAKYLEVALFRDNEEAISQLADALRRELDS